MGNRLIRMFRGVYAILIGLFSAIAGGISYCFVRAGAKASDQPVVTVFAFGLLSTPAAAICAFPFEIFLAWGLQLDKASKVTNIMYLEVTLTQFVGDEYIKSSYSS